MKKKKIIAIGFAILTIIVMILAMSGAIDETIGMCVGLSMTIIFNLVVAITAYKSDAKVITVLMIVFMILGMVFLGMNIVSLAQNRTPKASFKMNVSKDQSAKKSIFTYGGNNYYTYNMSNVEVIIKNETYSLKDAIEKGHVTLEEILSMAIPNEGTKGYKIYYDGGEDGVEKTQYSIIMCDDSKDVIFAPYDYTYEKTMCSSVAD